MDDKFHCDLVPCMTTEYYGSEPWDPVGVVGLSALWEVQILFSLAELSKRRVMLCLVAPVSALVTSIPWLRSS
ncbi:uncharacterized protein CTRU02_212253 [Colletotrichum truncatum]|uniref:Uncharacterized protein n=1 Tax=Colletotrichum truncatum TaxID=5467 RepID=A0ACC3YN17_COLTU